jgi:hypothetical protein
MERKPLKRVPMKRVVSGIKSGTKRLSKGKIDGNKKVSKRKPPTLSKLKKELDRVFSLYIRGKYEKKCYTCEYVGMLQNGHFVPRQYLAVRWDEDNCRPQCRNCNVFDHGKPFEFEERLVKELGATRVQEIKDARNGIVKLNRAFYEENIAKYKAILEAVDNPLQGEKTVQE